MKRRHFLQTTGAVVSLPVLLNGMKISTLPQTALFNNMNLENDRVLVIIQLNGGNDGLNMIIPIDQYDNLANARANILLPENSILPATDTTGFHPAMTGLKSLYDDGRIGVVQSAGYPDQNRSHFRSTDIWTSGSPAGEFWTTGWLGRYFEERNPDFPENYPNQEFPDPFAITMGSTVSETCQGTVANFSMTLNDPFNLTALTEGEPGDVPNTPYGEELTFLRTAIAQTNAYSENITAAAELGNNMATYPDDNRLALQLKNVALLMSGGLQTKVYIVSVGGFDTHANQVDINDSTIGLHAELMGTLSEAISVFQEDLKLLGLEERAIGMTFSEFGRKIKSNDSFGTDHGTAAPLIVFGSCVNPQILGDNPEIAPQVAASEGVPMQYDFRDIYGSILMDWFEVEESEVTSSLYPEFTYLPVLRNCSAVSSTDSILKPEIDLRCTPNPCRNLIRFQFTAEQEFGRLTIFDAMGSQIKVLFGQKLTAGTHEVTFDASRLPAGTYYAHLQMEGRQRTARFIKI
ncbi:MAG: hypothetical protein DHS20C18_50500 [Saprospiraceae bacterium]|nr:MAG: hypothetical protein DHS20C18_50500 [Saprospiraceae bacterium]